ncbi:MAG: DUF6153 family protein [Actinomycetota bacterium]
MKHERQVRMMNRMPAVLLPIRRPVLLPLALAAIILGILGMHTLSLSHLTPAAPVQTVGAEEQATGHASHQTHHLDAASSSLGAEGGLHLAACAGPCGSGHDVMTAVCVLMITGLVSLLFTPKQLRLKVRHGLRAPPCPANAHSVLSRAPSLVQLSISRT